MWQQSSARGFGVCGLWGMQAGLEGWHGAVTQAGERTCHSHSQLKATQKQLRTDASAGMHCLRRCVTATAHVVPPVQLAGAGRSHAPHAATAPAPPPLRTSATTRLPRLTTAMQSRRSTPSVTRQPATRRLPLPNTALTSAVPTGTRSSTARGGKERGQGAGSAVCERVLVGNNRVEIPPQVLLSWS